MCGIAGIVAGTPQISTPVVRQAMLQALSHRGPDGEGQWNNDAENLFLLHRRLSILDLTEAASQPLHYLHYTLVFNGELYNYRELKHTLGAHGYQFYTTGDTEVIAAAYDYWGADFLHQLDGMFAFALYDAVHQKLLIARDRFGEKPLYFFARYAERGKLQQLIFASEMKALWAAGIPKIMNHAMLVNYLALGYVQNPIVKSDTFYREILSLPPGYLLDVDMAALRFTMKRWYEPYKRIGHLSAGVLENEDEIIDQFHALLLQSVQRRLRSDVGIGTSLSGGLDSSSIVALIDALKKGTTDAVSWANVCFSAIFPGFEKDEAEWSKRVADWFNVKRYAISPTEADLVQQFETMLYHQEEPVQSSSVFTQYMVYQRAADQEIKVLLDGQGADEIMAGYIKYSHWYLQQLLRSNFKQMRLEKNLLRQNDMLPQWGWQNYMAAWLPWQTAQALKKKALKEVMQAPLQAEYRNNYLDKNTLFKPEVRNLEDMLYFNTFNFGLEELLRYADRNSMAHGCEVRLPFLQHELVEFIFSLPAHFKIREGFGKWILRKTMERYLPNELAWRKGKVGFEPPQQQWMQQKGLQEMVMESRRKLIGANIISSNELNNPIGQKAAHEAGNFDWRYLCSASIL